MFDHNPPSAVATPCLLLQLQNSVIATVTLSRAGKADRCVASLSLKAADGKPITAASTAKVQWTGEATVQQIQASSKAPGRLFTTSSTPSVPTKGCEVQVTELTVGGQLQPEGRTMGKFCASAVARVGAARFHTRPASLHEHTIMFCLPADTIPVNQHLPRRPASPSIPNLAPTDICMHCCCPFLVPPAGFPVTLAPGSVIRRQISWQ